MSSIINSQSPTQFSYQNVSKKESIENTINKLTFNLEIEDFNEESILMAAKEKLSPIEYKLLIENQSILTDVLDKAKKELSGLEKEEIAHRDEYAKKCNVLFRTDNQYKTLIGVHAPDDLVETSDARSTSAAHKQPAASIPAPTVTLPSALNYSLQYDHVDLEEHRLATKSTYSNEYRKLRDAIEEVIIQRKEERAEENRNILSIPKDVTIVTYTRSWPKKLA